MSKAIFLFSLLCLCLMTTALADIPRVINYQGRLTDASGEPVPTGNYLITFTIYDDPVSIISEHVKWTSGVRGVDVVDGLFSYNLGDSVALPPDLFSADMQLWLGIKIGTSAEMTPRIKLAAVPAAYQALYSDSSDFTATVADLSVTTAKLADLAATSAKIADLAITDSKIADLAILTAKLADRVVTTEKIALQAVGTTELDDYSVTGEKLAPYAVVTGKINALAVTTEKLANGAVIRDKIADAAINSAKLENNAVTSNHIADGAIQFSDIGPNGAADGQVMMRSGGTWTAASPIPAGVIVMWSGTLATIPNGWALCDGTGGRPDLRDKFIYGCSAGQNPGATGGEATTTHYHTTDIPVQTSSTPSTIYNKVWEVGGQWVAGVDHTHTIDPNPQNSDTKVLSNLPPYYKLAFIIKL